MNKLLASVSAVAALCMALASAQQKTTSGQRLDFVSLNTRQIQQLDRSRTVVIISGGILEEHGPYLPSGSDGIFNTHLADDLAAFVAAKPGWTAVMFPSIPLGAGAANEIGAKYSFPGSCTVLPSTLRAVFMDLADQLGKQGFRWVFIVHGHGDPVHNQMLDQAADYFHETYAGEMVNIFGYIWAAKKDFRTPEQQKLDGQDEHATMTETSVILALKPDWVSPDYKSARPHTGADTDELVQIAKAEDWPGYFGSPSLANAPLGKRIYEQWLAQSQELVSDVLAGKEYRKRPRYGQMFSDDPADAAAQSVNSQLQSQHAAWLRDRERPGNPIPARYLSPSSTEMDGSEAPLNNSDFRLAAAKRHQAMIEGDEAIVDRMTAKEYVQTDIFGHVQDKSTWMVEYFRPLAALTKAGKFRWERYDERDVRVVVLGDTAVVTGELVMKGTGAKPTQGKWEEAPGASIEGNFRFTRVWIKRDGSWLLAALQNSAPMGVR